jgi:hypothetical protein
MNGRLRAALAVFLPLLPLLLLMGCVSPYPPYKAAMLDQDPGLLGEWRTVENDQPESDEWVSLKFTSRKVVVIGDRLATSDDDRGPLLSRKRTVEQYAVEFRDQDGQKIEFLGYLLEAGDARLLGLQVGDANGPFMLPVHYILKLERAGDDLTLRIPDQVVVWLPDFEPVDGPEDPESPIALGEPADAVSFRVTSSIDRLASYYSANAGDASFWSDEPLVFRRVVASTGERESGSPKPDP